MFRHKKIIIVVASLVCCGLLISAAANETVRDAVSAFFSPRLWQTVQIQAKEVTLRNDARQTDDYYRSVQEDAMYALLRTLYTGDKLYEIVEEYATFKAVDKPTAQGLTYLYEQTANGGNISALIDVYRFWETTNTPFSMVNQIYSYYRDDEKQGRYWYENAFNLITENIYGVLDEEGVQGYLTSGLSRQDINAANIMSRKGVYTIQEILSLRQGGTSWAAIANSVYSFGIQNTAAYDGITDGSVMIDAEFLKNRTDKSVTEYLNTAISEGTLRGVKQVYSQDCMQNVLDGLMQQGLWNLPEEIRDENERHEQILKQQAIENGITAGQYEQLKEAGYDGLEIKDAAEAAKNKNIAVSQAMEEMR